MKKADAFFMRTRGGGVKSRVATALFKTRESQTYVVMRSLFIPALTPTPLLLRKQCLSHWERGWGEDSKRLKNRNFIS